MPVERDCCFLCMLSVGLPPVSMREIQPGVLGNYRDKPPSEHMCFGLTNLHKDSTWPVCFSAFHPYLNNTPPPLPPPQKMRNNNAYISKFVPPVCVSEERNTFQTATSAVIFCFFCVSFCDQHLSETSYSSVRPGLLLPPSYRVELRSFLSAFQQVFVNPTVGELAPANS